MKVVIVGRKDGARTIRWWALLSLSTVLALIVGAGMGFGYRLLAGQWNHLPVLLGIAMGISVAGIGLLNGLRSPLDELTPLE